MFEKTNHVELESAEQAILTTLGGLFGRPLPYTTRLLNFRLGFTASDKHITGVCLCQRIRSKQLTLFPECVTDLPFLRILYLKANKLTTIPDSIRKLRQLEILDLKYNKLTILPDAIGDLVSLKELYIEINSLASLPATITRLKSLRIISLDLSYLNKKPLPGEIREWLKELAAKGCKVHQ